MKTRVVQKAVLANPAGQILLLRRSKTDIRRPLQWDLPGGLLDDNEDLEACINREIKEETDLEAESLQPIYSKTEVRKWKSDDANHTENVVFIFYIGSVTQADPTLSSEHDKFQWMTFAQALDEIQYPLHREVIEHVVKNHLVQALKVDRWRLS